MSGGHRVATTEAKWEDAFVERRPREVGSYLLTA